MHELGHVVGFYHEQSRMDRDKHIIIDFSQISDDMIDQYSKRLDLQPDYYGVPYDLYSIMHYPSFGTLIQAIDERRSFLMGQRLALSYLDIKLANLAYKCSGSNLNASHAFIYEESIALKNCFFETLIVEACPYIKCQNEGFVNVNCKCICPDSFTGSLCEILISSDMSKIIAFSLFMICL